MQLELRFFATFRQAVGRKIVTWECDEEPVSTGEVLSDLVDEYPDLEFFDETGELREFLNIMKNGRDVTLLDGLQTPLEDGDRLSLFPPVAGGGARAIERSYRGISSRAAIHYLSRIGGEPTEETRVVGDRWRANVCAEKVDIGPTLQLTEVTVRFEGDPDVLQSVVDAFSQKAIRAGG